jgi:HTH-type transcriptional regulator, transcriptional repressor of NAD biosynthesis genes
MATEVTRRVRTVCLHGPESVGKSVLAANLAVHFNTVFVPEYGRTYCEQFGTALANHDLLTIGQTQATMAEVAAQRANRLLILDTDPLMTAVWSDMMLGRRDPWFAAFGATADLYLLLDIDLPWVDDGTRIYGDTLHRADFFNRCRDELVARGVDWTLVSGKDKDRTNAALDAITCTFPEFKSP